MTLPGTPGQLSAMAAGLGMSHGCVPGLARAFVCWPRCESSRALPDAALSDAALFTAALFCAAAGEEDAEEMAAAEKHIMQTLGWKGQGLIAAAGSADGLHGDPEGGSSGDGGSRGA